MWSQHRWIRAGLVLFVLGALGLTWAALGDFSRATDAAPPQTTCGCEQPDSEFIAQEEGESSAQERLSDGSFVVFVVPAGSAVSPVSMLVFTGPADGIGDAGDCGTGPMQNTVVINGPAGARSFTVNAIVVQVDGVANPPAVPPGTRVGSLVSNGTCDSGGYDKYTGVVE